MKSLSEYFEESYTIYYSGASSKVFIGNILVDECSMIGWRRISTEGPAFSYNNAYFSTILHGKYHIEGQIAINYVTTGYLEYIITKSELDLQMQLGLTTWRNPERNVEETKDIDKYRYSTYKKNPEQIPTSELKDSLRNYLWGHERENVDVIKKSVDSMLKNTYFDILITFGNLNGKDYSLRTIKRAKIVGDAMEISNDGAPVTLIYSFVAQKEDEPLEPEPPEVNIPIGQKIPLSEIRDYIYELGENIVNKNIVEPVGDTSLFLPITKKPFEASPDAAHQRFIPHRSDLVSVMFNKPNDDNESKLDYITSLLKNDSILGLSIYDTNGLPSSIADAYDIDLNDKTLNDTKKDIINKTLASNFVGLISNVPGISDLVPYITKSDAYGTYGDAPEYMFDEYISQSRHKDNPKRKAVVEAQFGIYNVLVWLEGNEEGGIPVDSFVEWANNIDNLEVSDDDKAKLYDTTKLTVDGDYGPTTELFVWFFQYLVKHDESGEVADKKYLEDDDFDIDGKMGKTTMTALDDAMRYQGFNINRELEYRCVNGTTNFDKISTYHCTIDYPDGFNILVPTEYGNNPEKWIEGDDIELLSLTNNDKERTLGIQWAMNYIMSRSQGQITTQDGVFDYGLKLVLDDFQSSYGIDTGAVGAETLTEINTILKNTYGFTFDMLTDEDFKEAIGDDVPEQITALMTLPNINFLKTMILNSTKDVDTEEGDSKLTNIPQTDTDLKPPVDKLSVYYEGEGLNENKRFDAYMFLFKQSSDNDTIKHFDFEMDYSDDQKRMSDKYGDFPLTPEGFVAVPRLFNNNRIGTYIVDDKPFIKTVKSSAQVIFNETWADGLYLTGSNSTNVEDSDMGKAIYDETGGAKSPGIYYDNDVIDTYIGENTDIKTNVFHEVDDIKFKSLYHNDKRMDNIGKEDELYVYPIIPNQLDDSEMRTFETMQHTMYVRQYSNTFNNKEYLMMFKPTSNFQVHQELYVNNRNHIYPLMKSKNNIFNETNEPLTIYPNILIGEDLTKINTIKDNIEGKCLKSKVSFNLDGDTILKGLIGDDCKNIVNGTSMDFSFVLIPGTDFSINASFELQYSNEGESTFKTLLSKDKIDIDVNNIYMGFDANKKDMIMYFKNDPLDMSDDEKAWEKMVSIALGFPYIREEDESDILQTKKWRISNFKLTLNGSYKIMLYGFPKSFVYNKWAPEIGHIKVDPLIQSTSDNMSNIMLPLPIINKNMDINECGKASIHSNEFVTVDDVYLCDSAYNDSLLDNRPRSLSHTDDFKGTLYPTSNETFKINQPSRTDVTINQLTANKAFNYYSYEEEEPYTVDYKSMHDYYNEKGGLKYSGFLVDPSSIIPTILVLDKSKDPNTVLENGLYVSYSIKRITRENELLSTTYTDDRSFRKSPAGLYMSTTDESTSSDWLPSKVYVKIDINKIAKALEARYSLAKEAALPLNDIKLKLKEGIKRAVAEPVNSTVSVNMYNGTFVERLLDAGEATLNAARNVLTIAGSVLTLNVFDTDDGLFKDEDDDYIVTIVAKYNI